MYKVSAQTDRATADRLSDLLHMMDPSPAGAVSTEEVSHVVWRIDAFAELEDDAEACLSIMTSEAPGVSPHIEKLEDKDWVAESLKGLPAVEAGRFYVAGAHELAFYEGGRTPIWIEAGPAFGTGHHGTTKGCLLALSKLARQRRIGKDLDLGTGSGVLAIAAMKLGAHSAIGTDIDAQSIRVAHENAHNNRMDRRLKLVHANGTKLAQVRSGAPYDLIMANILARPLVSLAPDILSVLKPGGHVILSGLLDYQQPQVKAAFSGRNLVLVDRLRLNRWATLVYRKPLTAPTEPAIQRRRTRGFLRMALG